MNFYLSIRRFSNKIIPHISRVLRAYNVCKYFVFAGLAGINLLFNSECLFLRVSRCADFTHHIGAAANVCTVPYLKYRGASLTRSRRWTIPARYLVPAQSTCDAPDEGRLEPTPLLGPSSWK